MSLSSMKKSQMALTMNLQSTNTVQPLSQFGKTLTNSFTDYDLPLNSKTSLKNSSKEIDSPSSTLQSKRYRLKYLEGHLVCQKKVIEQLENELAKLKSQDYETEKE